MNNPPPEIKKLLKRQAAWQKKQMDLSWVEKLRIAEAVLPDVKAIQKERKEQEKKENR